MLSFPMFSSPHPSLLAPRPLASHHNSPRRIIFAATLLESTLPIPPVTVLSKPLIAARFPLESTLTKKPRRAGAIIVNQISDEEICPDERSEEGPLFSRDDRRFRPCRKARLSRGASRRDTSLAITSLSYYLTDSLTQRRLDQNAIPSIMLKWSRTQGATRFRRKLSRPEGMPGPTCP